MDKKNTTNTVIRIANTTICIGIVVSVVFNVYQFNSNNILKSEIDTMEVDIETLGNENSILDQDIEASKNTLSSLSTQIEDLNSTITTLEADNKSLTDSLQELQKQLEEKEADITNTNDNSLSAEADNIVKKFNNNSTATTNQENWSNIGVPDNTANTPQIQFGQGDYSEGAGAQVY